MYRDSRMALPKVTKKDAGYYLRIWRAERDLTQHQAARFFDVTPSHWSLLEDGKRAASPLLAQVLAKATGARIEVFLNLEVAK